jgi:integrase
LNNARALLSGAFKRRLQKRRLQMARSRAIPVDGFELPTSTHTPRHTTAPELDDLLRLLATADEHDDLLAPLLRLGATTGLPRGELSGLRRDRLHLDRQELIVDNAINDVGGIVVEKQTETRSRRVVSLDHATSDLLFEATAPPQQQHLNDMDARASMCTSDGESTDAALKTCHSTAASTTTRGAS